jgi:D-serine deaminase-like pyridoxal phosphate-dependent protein
MWHTGDRTVTERRPGTYIYFDRSQVAAGAASFGDCALTVLTTVVSRPTALRAVIDAGSKSLSSDLLGLTGHGVVLGDESVIVKALSEEHGVIEFGQPTDTPRVGDRLRIIPNHVCVVSNLFDAVHLVRGEELLESVPVAARGRVD